MRLWSLHPKYLDVRGLTALWRESLLAQAVLHGKTRGYRNHPQLERFQSAPDPLTAIGVYLWAVQREAESRGYRFDRSKICARPDQRCKRLAVTDGQLEYELNHLRGKLAVRDRVRLQTIQGITVADFHPLFRKTAGPVADWERL